VFMIPDGTVLWKRRLKDTLAYRNDWWDECKREHS
jgi:hypothetical protein